MAKSLFEPKKIVRYANNQEIIEGGLAGAAVPSRQVSATRSVPKVDSIPADASNVGSSNTPVDFGGSTGDNNPPPPPPPPAGESRAFSFDGATELTSSWDSTGGDKTWAYPWMVSIRYWKLCSDVNRYARLRRL